MSTTPPPSTTAPVALFGVGDVARQLVQKPPILLGLILEVLPPLYLVVYGRGSAAGVVTLAILCSQMATLLGGFKVGSINALIFSVLLATCCLASGQPVAAGALALAIALWASLGVASGKGTLITMSASIMTLQVMVPPVVAHTASASSWRNVGQVFAYALVASVWGVLIALMLRRGRTIPSIPGASWTWGITQGLLVGGVMAVVAAVATWRHLGQGGAWLLMTTFLVFKPLTPTPWRRSLNRALGTMLGVLIVATYLKTLPATAPSTAVLIPGTLMLAAAALTIISQRWPYWCFVAVLTPGIVLLFACMTGSSKAVDLARHLDSLRFEYSLLGIAIALLMQAILTGITNVFHLETNGLMDHQARRDPGGA